MKNIYSLFVGLLIACSACSLTSCSSDEEELLEDYQISEYSVAIVGKWHVEGTTDYWRFDKFGTDSINYNESMKVVGMGEYWDESDKIGNKIKSIKFAWYLESNGLMAIHSILDPTTQEYFFSNPDPEAPFMIKSINTKQMIWVTNIDEQQSLIRQ